MTEQKYNELSTLFDEYFGGLKGGFVLSAEEYEKHKKASIESGLFEHQLSLGTLQKRNLATPYLEGNK